jgi:hypothetical protein
MGSGAFYFSFKPIGQQKNKFMGKCRSIRETQYFNNFGANSAENRQVPSAIDEIWQLLAWDFRRVIGSGACTPVSDAGEFAPIESVQPSQRKKDADDDRRCAEPLNHGNGNARRPPPQ